MCFWSHIQLLVQIHSTKTFFDSVCPIVLLPNFGKLGPNSWFILEAIIKALIFKSSHIRACLMKSGKPEARIVKADSGCVNSNTQTHDCYSKWYSTSNKGQLSSYFPIKIPGQVICQSLSSRCLWFSNKSYHVEKVLYTHMQWMVICNPPTQVEFIIVEFLYLNFDT